MQWDTLCICYCTLSMCSKSLPVAPHRWQRDALPAAGAQLLLRHLDQRPGPGTARQLAGLPLVTSNEQSSVPADVAISHARSAEASCSQLPCAPASWTASLRQQVAMHVCIACLMEAESFTPLR